jgi:RNA polymerase sigma-70 factor (ECF subfamily)
MNGEAVWRMTIPSSLSDASDATFERVFANEYARVVGIAARVLGDRSRAEDVAQEAFLALHRRRCSDQPWAGGWVCAAAAHRALNVLRGEQRRRRREHLAAVTAETADPAVTVERADDARVLRAALQRLSPRVATVLVLRHSGLSYAEVATAMNVSQHDIGTMLRRDEAALRKEVERAPSQ